MMKIKIGRHRIQISIEINHFKVSNLKGIWDGDELISKRKWKKRNHDSSNKKV